MTLSSHRSEEWAFQTAHTGCYLSAKAYGAACDELSRVVRRFETTLYGALFRGQSKKRHLHAHRSVSFMYNPEAKRRGHLLKSNCCCDIRRRMWRCHALARGAPQEMWHCSCGEAPRGEKIRACGQERARN